MKPISYNDLKFNSNWYYENLKTGCFYKSGIIQDKVLYSDIGGVIELSDVQKIDEILELTYAESNIQDKSYIRIVDFSNLDKITFKGRQHYIHTTKRLNLKYNSQSIVTYICTANHWLKATLIFAEKFLNQKFIAVSNVEEALEHINERKTLQDIDENEQLETEEIITIRKAEIDKILQFTSSVVWGATDNQMADYSIHDQSPLSELYQAIKIMATDKEEKLEGEKIISEERNKSFRMQKVLTDISSLFTKFGNVEHSINKAISLSGEFTNVSRVYIFEDFNDGKFTKNTYEWCNKNIKPEIDNLREVQYKTIPSYKKIFDEKGELYSENIYELPQDLIDLFEPQEIKSLLCFPLYVKNQFFGFIGFDECKRNRKWNTNEVELLKTIANIISSIFEQRKIENELKKSEKFLRKMADNYPNSYISIIEKDFTVSFASGQTFKKMNIAPESYIGLSLEEIYTDKAAFVKEQYKKTFNGEEISFELFINSKYQQHKVIPFNADDGSISRIFAVVENITAKKMREQEIEQYQNNLEELVNKRTKELIKYQEKLEDMVEERTLQFQLSEKKHRELLDNSIDAIMRFDREYRHLYVSPSIIEQSGINPEKFIGKTHEEMDFPTELNELWHKAIKEVFDSKKKNRIEFQLPDGKWIDWALAPEFNPEGEVISVLTSARDITENHLFRAKLSENMERYRALFNSGSDAIFVNQYISDNKLGTFIEVNDVACKMLGYTREELLEMANEDISSMDSGEFNKIIKELNNLKHVIFETILVKKDGSKIDAEVNSHLFTLNNAPTMLCIARNITERKKDEKLLRIKNKELEMFNESMLNREMRVIELKEEVNKLAEKLKEEPPYPPIWNKDRGTDV
ncbi:MAG: PAS domain S-box protein [Melioribacteraceae bacterium]|nr:PAS domain S-box protein [Melioribacteraceae bacterium]